MLMNGQTDMTKLIVAFRNFAKNPKNEFVRPIWASDTLHYFYGVTSTFT